MTGGCEPSAVPDQWVASVGKIAVLRANAIGDLIVSLPAFAALRAAYPHAEIVLLGKRWHAEFLQGRCGPIDRVKILPPWPGVTTNAGESRCADEQERFLTCMRAECFDIAVQLHGGGRHSNPLVQQLGAGVTVGPCAGDAQPLDRWMPYDRWQHETVRGLEVARLVGARAIDLQPHLALRPSDREEASRVVQSVSDPLIALHPGASNPERWWPAERFAAVGDALAGGGARLVIVGTEEDGNQVKDVASYLRAPAINLSGRLSLGGLVGLLSRCRLLVANDSGPLHLAAALDIPTVGIYSFFNLTTHGPLTRARHLPVVSWRTEPEGDGASFLTDVGVEAVLANARRLL